MEDPVVQVIEELTGKVVYTLRINGRTFRPKVFDKGVYTVKVGEPGQKGIVLKGVKSIAEDDATVIQVKL